MELKYRNIRIKRTKITSYNRTFMELKYICYIRIEIVISL